MDTKLKSDIAESAVVTELLKKGFKVLRPVGDRLPYDLAIDIHGKLLKIQVKSAWLQKGAYTVDTRRTKTNRRHMVRERYKEVELVLSRIGQGNGSQNPQNIESVGIYCPSGLLSR